MSTPIWSTFSGIGGLELGLEMAGLGPVVLQCEFEEWNRALLAERWPGVTQHADIRTLEAKHGQAPVILCGGFPCQDLSLAGARQGFDGTKSALWWEMARVLAETRPPFAVFENVAAILSDVRPVVPPRADWLGDAPAEPFLGAFSAVLWTLAALGWRRAIERARAEAPWTYLPRVGGTADGVPGGVDRPCQPWEQGEARTKPHQAHWKQRLRGLGNACLPLAARVPGFVVRELMDWGAP